MVCVCYCNDMCVLLQWYVCVTTLTCVITMVCGCYHSYVCVTTMLCVCYCNGKPAVGGGVVLDVI